jgi:hypothetical protein
VEKPADAGENNVDAGNETVAVDEDDDAEVDF